MTIRGFRNRRGARFCDGDFVSDYQGVKRQARYRLSLLSHGDSLRALADYSGNGLERLSRESKNLRWLLRRFEAYRVVIGC